MKKNENSMQAFEIVLVYALWSSTREDSKYDYECLE